MRAQRKRDPVVSGQEAASRVMRSLDYRLTPETEPLTEMQVAVVIRALCDHTLIQDAMTFDPDQGPWPVATSIGRFFHALSDQLEEAHYHRVESEHPSEGADR